MAFFFVILKYVYSSWNVINIYVSFILHEYEFSADVLLFWLDEQTREKKKEIFFELKSK